MGSAWVWNPARWRTSDGYVDYHSMIAAMPAIRRHRAQRRIELALAFRLGHGGEEIRQLAESTDREASE